MVKLRLTCEPTEYVWLAGAVTVGLATMFQVKAAVVAETLELSVTRTVTLLST